MEQRSMFLGPVQAALLGSCAVTATAAVLGAEWIREPYAGLPLGLWVVAGATGLACWRGGARHPAAASIVPPSGARASERLGRLLARGAEGLFGASSVPFFGTSVRLDRLESAICAWHDRGIWKPAPLHIGLDVPDEARRALADGGRGIEWIALPAGTDASSALAPSYLDAVIRQRPDGTYALSTPERDGCEAAWFDWNGPRPFSFASVFPGRVDAAHVTLGSVDFALDEDVADLLVVVRAAATLARAAPRLTLADRLAGRLPSDLRRGRSASTSEDAMWDLVAHVERAAGGARRSPTRTAAARVAGAWLAGTGARIEPESRLRGIAAAHRLIGDEPETLLRLAAARVAMYQDGTALEAVARADRAAKMAGVEVLGDPLAFVQSEIALGMQDPMSLGRVAGGLALVAISTPTDRLDYIRDDIIEDMLHCDWLVGREADQSLLMDIFRRTGQARRADSAPAKAA